MTLYQLKHPFIFAEMPLPLIQFSALLAYRPLLRSFTFSLNEWVIPLQYCDEVFEWLLLEIFPLSNIQCCGVDADDSSGDPLLSQRDG
jgi:hypothetical protein